jgi:hypothetical protein
MGLGYGISVMPKGGLTRLMSASAVESFDDFYSTFRHSNRGSGGSQKNYVYRVIRPDEMPHKGLTAKMPGDTHYTIEGHILHGNRKSFKGSRFISTTRDLDVAKKYAKQDQRIIVRIDLNQIYSQIYDLSTQAGRDEYLKGRTSRNWAGKSAEVLIEDFIPPEAIDLIFTPD